MHLAHYPNNCFSILLLSKGRYIMHQVHESSLSNGGCSQWYTPQVWGHVRGRTYISDAWCIFFFPFQDVLDVASHPNLLKYCDLRFCLMLEVERRPKFHIWSIHLSWIKLKILHFISHQIEHKPKRNKVYKNSILNMITTCYILDSLIKFNDVVELINKIWLI